MLELEAHHLVEKLYLNHHNKLINFAYNFSSDYDIVSELVQSTYLTLLEFKDINFDFFNDVNMVYLDMFVA